MPGFCSLRAVDFAMITWGEVEGVGELGGALSTRLRIGFVWRFRMDKLSQVVALSIGGVLGVNCALLVRPLGQPLGESGVSMADFPDQCIGFVRDRFSRHCVARWLPHPNYRLLVITGFLGGYTTYSSFAFESFVLWERGEKGMSLGYIAGTVVAGLLAVMLGVAFAPSQRLAARLAPRRPGCFGPTVRRAQPEGPS